MVTTAKAAKSATTNKKQNQREGVGGFLGELYAFNNSLKLYHWHVSGKGSYSEHIALDQALEELPDALDRIVETSYALRGDIAITIPETSSPTEIVRHCEDFYAYIDRQRALFPENFIQAILDDYQEAIQQLLFRLKRLQ